MVTCSVNIITGSSEKTLMQCLDSINKAECFSEIVIAVDDRANQETIKIILDYDDKIPMTAFSYRWGSDGFSGARNAVLKASTGQYVMWIDSDETIENGVCDLLQNPQGAYYIHQVSKLEDGKTVDVPQVRLFPNIPGVKWDLPIHEQIMFSLEKLKIPMLDSQIIARHSGYDNAEKIEKKHIRNFGFLHEYVTTQKEDRKMQYVKDRYNESFSYLHSIGMAGSGTIGTIATLIISIAVPLITQGIATNSAVNQAKQEANINRLLTAQEINEIAIGLNAKFPSVSVQDWILNIQLSTPTTPPGTLPPYTRPPDDLPTTDQNTYLYIALAVLAFAMIRR